MRWFFGFLFAAAFTLPSQIKFQANGTGSASRSLAAKLGDVVSVLDFTGCDTTGATDSTACIQSAHDAQTAGKTVLVPIGTYLLSGTGITISKSLTFQMEKGATLTTAGTSAIVVSGASAVRIRGGAITLQNNSAGSTQYAINPSGTVSDLVVEDVTISGTGTVPDGTHGIQTGFGNSSGQTLSNIEVRRNTISAVNNGISFNADLSGSLSDVRAIGNHLSNIVGTVSGQGYGIHCAYGGSVTAKFQALYNDIDSGQRHDIYNAKCGSSTIAYNHSTNHRIGICDGTERPAIHIGRSQNVTVVGNVIESPCDGAMSAFTDDASFNLANITFTGNVVHNWKAFPALTIGDAAPASDGTISNIVVGGNVFSVDLAVTGDSGGAGEAMRVYFGKNITISNNSFEMLNAPSSSNMATFYGQGETAGTSTYSDNIRLIGNAFTATGTATKAIRFDTAMCSAGSRMDFVGNRTIGTTTTFSPGATHTNTNFYVLNQLIDGLDATKLHSLEGNLVQGGSTTLSSLSLTNNIVVGGQVIASSGAGTLSMRGQVTDGSLAVANRAGSTNALSTAGAQIMAFYSDNFSTKVSFVDLRGGYNMGTVLQANLGTPPNGTILYCSDCTPTPTCAGSGNGAFAARINSAWTCNGGGIGSEHDFAAYNAANLAGATAFAQTIVTNASTVTAASTITHDIAGAGTGTFVAKLCSDGVTCGAGNVYLTCTAGATCAAAVAGRIDACTVTKAAVTAGTTLTWSVATACGTTDPGINAVAHFTTP